MASSSSQGSASRKKVRPMEPISIGDDGQLFGPHYDALTERISSHVCHCDQFSPILKWADHKRAGRVQDLRGPCSKYYYVLLVFMSIYLISLTYFTNDRVCYMQGIFALPPGLIRELLPPSFAIGSTTSPIKGGVTTRTAPCAALLITMVKALLKIRLPIATPRFGAISSSNIVRIVRRRSTRLAW